MPISRIKTDGIQDDAITSAKIGDTNIASADIADNAVTTAKIADSQITDAKIASGITASKLTGDLPAISGANLTGVGVDGITSTANATAITIDSSENVGIGTSPSSWWSGMTAVETQSSSGGVFASASVNGHFLTNAYYDGSNWKYTNSGSAEYYSQTGGIHQFLTAASGTAEANITWSERIRLDSDGLKFNGDTAAANALDDYEEGTWTPTQGTFSTWNSPVFVATYTKIGRQVTVLLRQDSGTVGWSSNNAIGGLPFSVSYQSIGYASDSGPSSDNGPVLIWPTNLIYFNTSNSSENGLVLTATYFTND